MKNAKASANPRVSKKDRDEAALARKNMGKIEQPTIIILVGISGDLARRYSLPALEKIAKLGLLPKKFHIMGVSRRDLSIEDVLKTDQIYLRDHVELFKMNLDDRAAYSGLSKRLKEIQKSFGENTQRLFYLSVPPKAYKPVIALLGESGLSKGKNTKLLLEKPFGTDLKTTEQLINGIQAYFKEEQAYRIDHYLAKEMTQNLVVFRGDNPIFKNTWHTDFIERIDVIATETIGIEGRRVFYEQTGALRDVVQSHLLQLAALTLMDLPETDDWQAVPAMRLEALKALELTGQAVRGQYKGYRKEVNNPKSNVETFVALNLRSKHPRWKNVPITLVAGKSLDKRTTEIRLKYRSDGTHAANELILHIQPNEGVEICLWAKAPGYERQLQQFPLKFEYSQYFEGLPAAYERVFVDAMRSNRSLFTGSEEVLASWHILEPLQKKWAKSGDKLVSYKPGSTFEQVIKLSK